MLKIETSFILHPICFVSAHFEFARNATQFARNAPHFARNATHLAHDAISNRFDVVLRSAVRLIIKM